MSVRLVMPAVLAIASASRAAPTFKAGVQTGTLVNTSINEASGLAVSRANAGVFWTHNDSGDSARVFATTPAGANLGTYSLAGATAFDWEDISVGPGPTPGQQYLYVADTGDNDAVRTSVAIYRVPEPAVSATQSPTSKSLAGVDKLTFTYPDGPHDAESMFVDPATRDLYIITKRDTPNKRVYRAAYPQSTGPTQLEYVTQFASTTFFTSADISLDGSEIIIRGTEQSTGRMFLRPVGGSIAAAFNTTPITTPLANETQGEAIAFATNGKGYYTLSEGVGSPIWFFAEVPEPGSLTGIAAAALLVRRRH